MKKVLSILGVTVIFIGGFILGSTRSGSYDNEQLLNYLFSYIPLFDKIDFQYLIIRGNTVYFTREDSLAPLLNYVDGKDAEIKVKALKLPPEILGKNTNIKIH